MRTTILVRKIGIGLVLAAATSGPSIGQNRDVRHCLSISDVDARVECMEGETPSAPTQPVPNPARRASVNPSFDCRAANSSIERAICRSPTLSELDSRMAEQYRLASSRVAGPTVLEEQRRWLAQRNASCGPLAEPAISRCVADATSARIASLAASINSAATVSNSANAIGEKGQEPTERGASIAAPKAAQTPAVQAQLPAQRQSELLTPSTNPSPARTVSTSGDGSSASFYLGVAFLFFVVWLATKALRRMLRVKGLTKKFGEEDARRIMDQKVWMGMTDEQLQESWGAPAEISNEVRRGYVKQTWKYNQTGKNRFKSRVFLENGFVTGWNQ